MNDKELLELAAKAAGLDGEYCEPNHEPAMYVQPGTLWMPLTDDGDAMRLACALKLLVNIDPSHTEVRWVDEELSETFSLEQWDDGPQEQTPDLRTRRAIVSAAAEIGKAMS